ncbi:MAG TPA: energy transducer TonB [Prolixibacteraceae bacterium]|nr:energy transducer TonB [Prolixibacteraceae bacterium]
MELKKSPKANLENKRKLFFEFGLVVAILICLLGFEMSSGVKETKTFGTLDGQYVEDQIIPLVPVEEKQPTPPPPPRLVDLLVIVDNNTEITEELDIVDSEADANTVINAAMQLYQKKEPEDEDVSIFLVPEQMPEFPGGNAALLHYLSQNVKYPAIAADNGVYGKVSVNFVVNKDGSVSDAKIIRGVDPSLDKEALRVVYSMPKWKPGLQGGKPVRVSFTVPINFVLQR